MFAQFNRRNVVCLAAAGLTAVWFAGCEEKGPAEKAGEKIDDAAKDAGKAVERAGEDIQDAAKRNK